MMEIQKQSEEDFSNVPVTGKISRVDLTEQDDGEKICRCCHCVLTENDDYIAPCKCTGSMKYVHRYCLVGVCSFFII